MTAGEVLQRLACNVRLARHSLRWSQQKAARRAGLHPRHWQKIEAAEVAVTLETLAQLGNALRMEPANLLQKRQP